VSAALWFAAGVFALYLARRFLYAYAVRALGREDSTLTTDFLDKFGYRGLVKLRDAIDAELKRRAAP
jgi:hypothetical protein